MFLRNLAASIAVAMLALSMGKSVAQESQEAPERERPGYSDSDWQPDGKWRVHDRRRPYPPMVTPPSQPGGAPSDAIVLFDGGDLSQWKSTKQGEDGPLPAAWKVEGGYMEVAGGGSIVTKESFGDCQLHLEWAAPAEVKGESQGRGNSGVLLMGDFEIQVLDSFDNPTYADGQAGSVYGQYPPRVNASREPGEWQSYDIIFEAPRFHQDKLMRPAYVTVFHNGVLLHHHRRVQGPVKHKYATSYDKVLPAEAPLMLQDHGDAVRYRNIWVRRLKNSSEPWVTYQGQEGPGVGKHIVFLTGDEEYRSEEAGPMLAKILAFRHGFKCTVLFAIDPETGVIDPNNQTNIPGMEALDDADLAVVNLRFRELPDEDMKHFVDFVNAGKPVIGLRTATHAFNYSRNKESKYVDWSFNSRNWKGGFGQQVLGDTWISHHGNHKSESTRGVVFEPNQDHPVLRGVQDVWGPTDVYGVRNLTDDAVVLLQGQVLAGMQPDDPPVEGPKNNPMMPLAWVKEYKTETDNTCKVFCTTMGASIDLKCEDLRRLIVNACFWGLDLEVPERADVALWDDFEPSFYGFQRGDYWLKKGLKPQFFEVESRE